MSLYISLYIYHYPRAFNEIILRYFSTGSNCLSSSSGLYLQYELIESYNTMPSIPHDAAVGEFSRLLLKKLIEMQIIDEFASKHSGVLEFY